MKLPILTLGLIGLAVAIAPVVVNAQMPGRHPAYLHARSDLRAAQFLLRVREEPNVTRHLVQADHEVEAAVLEIDHAAVLDHKDLDDHPHVDMNFDRLGRFRRTVELLREARADLARGAGRDGLHRRDFADWRFGCGPEAGNAAAFRRGER